MAKDISRLVLAIEVAGHLQGAMALRAVHEDRNGEKISLDGQFTAGEDRARRGAELMVATLALEKGAGLEAIDAQAAASGAHRLAVRVGPADILESLPGFVGGHPGNLHKGKGAGRFGEKKVLRHVFAQTNDFR